MMPTGWYCTTGVTGTAHNGNPKSENPDPKTCGSGGLETQVLRLEDIAPTHYAL